MRTNQIYKIKLFLILLLIVLLPQVVLSETPKRGESLQNKITYIDMQLNEKTIQRENFLKELNKISAFSTVARSWFSKISKKDAAIKALEKQKRNDFENNPVVKDIKKKKRELEALRKLNGRTIVSYSKKSCKTVKHLLHEFHAASDKSKYINQELIKLNQKINELLEDHDNASKYLEVLNGINKDDVRKEINIYQREYDYLYNLANNKNSWIMMDPMLHEPIIVDKGIFLRYITQEYLKDVRVGEYDQVKFARYVKKRQKEASEHTKAMQHAIKNTRLPELRQKLDNLNKKFDALNITVVKLQGCWLLTTGRSTSTINIYRDKDNFYHGILVKNKLKYYRDGSEIFKVKRQTYDTFKGYENSFTKKGYSKRNNVTIQVHKNGNFLTYTSDARTKMYRCQ